MTYKPQVLATSDGGTGNANGTIAVGSVTGLGTGVATSLAINVGSAGAPVTFNGAAGTPSSITLTNATGTAASLTAGTVTTNANLTGVITSSGNTTSIASQTGTGSKFVVDTSPTLVTPNIGVATASSITVGGASKIETDGTVYCNQITTTDPMTNKVPGTTFAATSGIIRNYVTGGLNLIMGLNTSGGTYLQFNYNGATPIGSIAAVGTTAVVYNTTSDKNLKQDLSPLENSGEILDALNPVNFTWKGDARRDIGLIAQEVISIVPQAVTEGHTNTFEDSEGNVTEQQVPWQMDYSKLIPYLIAEIKALRTRVANLEIS